MKNYNNIKKEIILKLPQGADIVDIKKVKKDHFVMPEIPGDEYIVRISINVDEDIFNNMFLFKDGKLINIHTTMIPLGKDAYE